MTTKFGSFLSPILGTVLILFTLVACDQKTTKQQPESETARVESTQAVGGDIAVENTGDEEQALDMPTGAPALTDSSSATKSEDIFDQYEFSAVNETLPQSDNENGNQQGNTPYCLGLTQEQPITPAQACKRISKRLASVSNKDCEMAELQPTQCLSVNNFPILVREFAPLKDKTPQGRILVIGGMHGDELTSVSVLFRWIEKLNLYHSGLFHWHIVPMMNPDGVLKRAASRTNINGIDLNRNMPTNDWDNKALEYWKTKTDSNPRRYPGEEAASEPETQWLIDEINNFKPDAIISVHAPYGVVDFDALILNTAPKSLGRLRLNLLGTFPGSLGNYAGINRNIPVITLELPHAWEMPTANETTKIWEDIVSWLKSNVNQDMANK